MMSEEESDIAADIETDNNGQSTEKHVDKKKLFRKKAKRQQQQQRPADDETPLPPRRNFPKFFRKSKRSGVASSSDGEDFGCDPFARRNAKKTFTTEEYNIETTIVINRMKGNFVMPSTANINSSEGAATQININVDNKALIEAILTGKTDDYETFSRVINACQGNVRASLRKKTSKTSYSNDIEHDGGDITETVGNAGDDDDDNGIQDVNGNDLKSMLESLALGGHNETSVRAEIHETNDGEISVTWRVLVKKITEHDNGSSGWAISRVVLIIMCSAAVIIAAMLLLHFLGVLDKPL